MINYIPKPYDIDLSRFTFTWQSNLVKPLESLISVISKFAFLNCMTIKGVVELVRVNCEEPICNNSICNIDFDRLECMLGHPVRNILGYDTTRTVPQMPSPWLFNETSLRYCPDCLKLGYHCYYHQLNLIQNCKIHGTKLITGCVNCNSEIKYNLSYSSQNIYYCNKCKESIWKPDYNANLLSLMIPDDYIVLYNDIANNLLRLRSIISMSCDPLKLNIIFTNVYQQNVSEYSAMLFKSIFKSLNICTGKYLNELNANSCLPNSAHRYVNLGKPNKSVDIIDTNTTDKLLTSIYKSIRRHFQNKYIKRHHKQCVKHFISAVWWRPQASHEIRYCLLSIIFLTWRFYWEQTIKNKDIKLRLKRGSTLSNYLISEYEVDERLQKASVTLSAVAFYWSFYETMLNAISLEEDNNLFWGIRLFKGDYLPYWHIEESENTCSTLHVWSSTPFIVDDSVFLKGESPKDHVKRSFEIANELQNRPFYKRNSSKKPTRVIS